MFSCFCETFCCCLHRFRDSSSRNTPTSSSSNKNKNKDVAEQGVRQKEEGTATENNGRARGVEDVQPAPRIPMPSLGGGFTESDTSKRESSSHQSDAHSEEPAQSPGHLSVSPLHIFAREIMPDVRREEVVSFSPLGLLIVGVDQHVLTAYIIMLTLPAAAPPQSLPAILHLLEGPHPAPIAGSAPTEPITPTDPRDPAHPRLTLGRDRQCIGRIDAARDLPVPQPAVPRRSASAQLDGDPLDHRRYAVRERLPSREHHAEL